MDGVPQSTWAVFCFKLHTQFMRHKGLSGHPAAAHAGSRERAQRVELMSHYHFCLLPPNARSTLTHSFQAMPPALLITYNCTGRVTSLINGCSDKHCML